MNKCLLIIILLISINCDENNRSMTNEQVIEECNKCKRAGMEPQIIQNIWTYKTIRVNCVIR